MTEESSRFSAVIRLRKTNGINYAKILGRRNRYKRGTVSASDNGRVLTIHIEADDSTALRASLNTVMRELNLLESISSIKLPAVTRFYARPNVQLRKEPRTARADRARHPSHPHRT